MATPTTPTIGPEREADPVVHPDRLLVDVEDVGHGRAHLVDQLPELGDDRREAARAGADLEQLDDERVARLGAAHRDRAGGAVDAGEVDVADEVLLGLDLAGEAVVRLEADCCPGLDLEHRLEVGPEAPDHLVARDDVIDGDGSHQTVVAGAGGASNGPAGPTGLLLDEDLVGVLERVRFRRVHPRGHQDTGCEPADGYQFPKRSG